MSEVSDVLAEIKAKAARGPVAKSGPLRIWEYGGKLYADGLFAMHDQEGFSLTDSLIQCKKKGWIPCMDQFRADALRAGWRRDKIDALIIASLADSRM